MMVKKEYILMFCVAILVCGCVYLLWENKRLKRKLDKEGIAVVKVAPEVTEDRESPEVTEDRESPEVTEDRESPEVTEDRESPEVTEESIPNNEEDYIIDENIPEELKNEIDALNLDETHEDFVDEIIIDTRSSDDEVVKMEQSIQSKLNNMKIGSNIVDMIMVDEDDSVVGLDESPQVFKLDDGNNVVELDNTVQVVELDDDNNVQVVGLDGVTGLPVVTVTNSGNYTEEGLLKKTLKELGDICRENKLKLKGKKSDLINRILSL